MNSVTYSVFDTESGELVRTGYCFESDVDLQARPGEISVIGVFSSAHHYFNGTAIAPYPEEVVTEKSNRPRFATRWNNAELRWDLLPEPARLAMLKSERWDQLKEARTAAEFAEFDAAGMTFDGNPFAQVRIQGAVQLATLALAAGQPFSVDWTLADNTVVALNAEQMVLVGQSLAQHIQAIYGKGRMLRQRLAAAQTPEEIAAVQW